jgi:hypothetical protein
VQVNVSGTISGTTATVPAPLWYIPFANDNHDASGNGHTGNNQNGTFVQDPVRGFVLSLNGTNACVTVNAPLPASFTKAAWVKLTAFSVNATAPAVIESGINTPTNFDVFRINQAGYLRPGAVVGGTFYHPADDPSAFPLNTWVHVAVTYDAATQTYSLYHNGSLIASGTAPSPSGITSEDIGCLANSTDWWAGNISKAELWSSALNASQIAAVYGGATGVAHASAASGPTDASTNQLSNLASVLAAVQSILQSLQSREH